jgi:hypothetical protein
MSNFQRALSGLKKSQVIIPVIRSTMADPDFAGFVVTVRGWKAGHREFDGWFHPSTHATWTARQLALYLKHGEDVPQERPGLEFVLAVTQGSFWHEFMQRLLLKRGILRRNPGSTNKDNIEKQVEVTLVDDEHNRRGHADGRLAICDDELFEFKTMNDWKIKKYDNPDAEDVLREENPFGYWTQAQEYMDMAGIPKMRFVIMSMSSPYPMTEFVVHANPHFQRQQRAKYREALEAAREDRLPEACCGIGSKQATACPVKDFCPIGRMS